VVVCAEAEKERSPLIVPATKTIDKSISNERNKALNLFILYLPGFLDTNPQMP
jgi:hypothetical protein